MARKTRPDAAGAWHHVMNRGVDHQITFFDDGDRVLFERLMGEHLADNGIEVHAYCLMTNHFHALVACPEGGLSHAMQCLGSRYTRRVNDRLGRDGPLFRGRFNSVLVTSTAQMVATMRYIHRNPLDISPQVTLGRYRWSSHGVYLQSRRRPAWLTTSAVLGHFNGSMSAYQDFVEDAGAGPPRIEDVAATVRACAAEVGATVDLDHRRRPARSIALVLCAEMCAASAAELAAYFGFPSAASVRAGLHRARQWIADDVRLAALLELARGQLSARTVGTPVTPVSDPGVTPA